jgi:WD40 repeat protein
MNQLEVDSSNNCIPPAHPLCGLFAPLPSTTRGEPTLLDGTGGRLNAGRPLLLYGSGRLVIVRELAKAVVSGDNVNGNIDASSTSDSDSTIHIQCKNGATIEGSQDCASSGKNKLIQGFVYRGHGSTVTVAKFSPSGAYVASGDTRGCIRIWSYDNDEHLCKLDVKGILSGPIRDIAWDADGKRVS